MALADYFSKDLLAMSQILKSGSGDQFRATLNQSVIGIAFDDAIDTAEGYIALDLTVRLLSRLYPKLNFIDYSKSHSKKKWEALSKSINSKIEIVNDEPTITLMVGMTRFEPSALQPVFYIGSDGWIAKLSSTVPVGSGLQQNPFGAGFAACIAVSNVFRFIFREFLDDVRYDKELSFSVLVLESSNSINDYTLLDFNLEDFILVGFGAIGNGAIWTLSHLPLMLGKLTLIEPQTVESTNLQRYILAEERHIEKSKTEIAHDILKGSRLSLECIDNDWASYLTMNGNLHNKSILIAIDNIADRIAIQSMLPRTIINSYTENGLVGISRHEDFVNDACLVCTYMPTIRNYLHYNMVADEPLLRIIAKSNNIDYLELTRFKGLPVSDFYGKVVCGGILLELKGGSMTTENIEAPMAFQSALAGILLVAEKVIEMGNIRKNSLPNKTHIYPLLPISQDTNPYSHTFPKDATGRCICCDQDFTSRYKTKWPAMISNIEV
jgi:hypothetical protein